MRIQSRLRRKLKTAGSALREPERTLERWVTSITGSVGLHDGRGLGRLDTEEALEDLQRGRRSRGRAVPAVLDQRADDEAGRVRRAPSTPPGLILEMVDRIAGERHDLLRRP